MISPVALNLSYSMRPKHIYYVDDSGGGIYQLVIMPYFLVFL